MLKKIILDNYMSHARTELELAPGLTVVCGPNNCGKSAIVSAIETVCNNNAGSFMVRHGADEARVTIHTDDGHELVWRRRKNVVSYSIDGRDVHRLGRDVPADLHTLLRLPRIWYQNEPFDVHLGQQKSPIFLIDNEARAAAFFSTTSDAERLLEMQKLHRQRRDERRREADRLQADLLRLDSQLTPLAPLADLEPQIEQLESVHAGLLTADADWRRLGELVERQRLQLLQVRSQEQRVQVLQALGAPPALADEVALTALVERTEQAGQRQAKLAAEHVALVPLMSPPVLADDDLLAALLGRLRRQFVAEARCGARSAVLGDLPMPPPVEDEACLMSLISTVESATLLQRHCQSRAETLAGLSGVPELDDDSPLCDLVKRLRAAETLTQAADGRARVLVHLKTVPEPQDTEPLHRQVGLMETAELAVTRAAAELDQAVLAVAAVRRAVEEWSQRNPTCPTCGAPTDVDRLLEGVHAHA